MRSCGALVLQFLPAPFALWRPEANPDVSFLAVGVALAIAGVLSTTVMALTLHYASSIAATGRASAENARRLGLVAHAANIGVFERTAGQDYGDFDEGMYKIFGLTGTGGTVAVSVWERMILPEDMPALRVVLAKVWSGQPPDTATPFRITRPDGELRHVQAHWITEPRGSAKVDRIVGIYEDVTVSIRAQIGKAEAESRLQNIAENLPGALHSLEMPPGGALTLKYLSPTCVKIWGYTRDELLADPKSFARMHDPEDLPTMLDAFARAAETLEPFTRRFAITARGGEKKWLEIHSSATRFDNGTVQIDSIFLDVTTEVEAQKQLEVQIRVAHQAQKNESIGQLTGGVAHDFNNLLAIIMGNLELLREDIDDTGQRAMIETALAAVMRGADLTRNMLAFARKARLEPRVIDLNKLVRDTKNWTGRTIPASIEIETSLLAGLWPIEADPSSTESALLNLMLNARDAMGAGGRLTIETANIRIDDTYMDSREVELSPGRYVMLAVSDTGHGIPPEALSDIFEPFFSTKAPGKGTGLGLSMIQGFMRQSGGLVQVYSEPGLGTTFKLYFRATENSAIPEITRPSRPEQKPHSARILVAEDEPEVLSVIVTTLEKAGYHVTPARSGDEARALFEAGPHFDLLLTDIVMPGSLLGTKLAKVLREQDPGLSVVFMSGYASEATVHGNGLRPEDIRLMKPIQRHMLLSAVAKSLGQSG